MIASVLRLSRADCIALKITDAYSIHRVVYSLFPKENDVSRQFLFADKGGDFLNRQILILSDREPLIPGYGTIESKTIPESFLTHQQYGFEVQLNPTKRDKSNGKIVAVRGRENLLTWFSHKAPSWGFEVQPDSLDVRNVGVQTFKKDNATVVQGSATFAGRLSVIDREVFQQSFTQGIGRAKGFGFGLFQIVPLQRR